MILSDVLNRIKWKIGSTDDINSKAINPLVSTSNILYELNAQMIKYANHTKGIQDMFSVPVDSNTQFLNAPQYALRSLAYRYAYLITRGWINPIDIRGQRDVFSVFRISPIKGIGSWLMVLNEINQQRLFLYPMSGTNYNTTTLTSGISAVATTLPVASTDSFISTNGRVTIGSEKILYQYKDATNFYGCVRGIELTTAITHNTSDTVNENNLIINYSRLPVPLTITDTPSSGDLATALEIVDDHIEGLCDIVAYSLLCKISPDRANMYKVDGDALMEQYKMDIGKGYNKMRSGVNVKEAGIQESGVPFNNGRY